MHMFKLVVQSYIIGRHIYHMSLLTCSPISSLVSLLLVFRLVETLWTYLYNEHLDMTLLREQIVIIIVWIDIGS